jgi:hypothetical protein
MFNRDLGAENKSIETCLASSEHAIEDMPKEKKEATDRSADFSRSKLRINISVQWN